MTLIKVIMTLIKVIMTLIKVVMTLIKSGHDTIRGQNRQSYTKTGRCLAIKGKSVTITSRRVSHDTNWRRS